MQLIPVSGHGLAIGLLIASYPVLLAFAFANIRLAGFVLIFVGLALNLTVIAANQGMPVTRHALVASGQGSLLGDLEHHVAGVRDDRLPTACDGSPQGAARPKNFASLRHLSR